MVARYNPCGRCVDIGRAPFTCRARLYPGDPTEYVLEWYICREGAPLLGFPSAVSNLMWERDQDDEFLETDVGEIPLTRDDGEWLEKPLATGGHVCGTPADFLGDGVLQPNPPYVEYRDDGLPTCCADVLEARGGGKGGGVADWHWLDYGPSCCDAPVTAHGVPVSVPMPAPGLAFRWVRWEVPGTTATLTVSGQPGVPISLAVVFTGPTCSTVGSLVNITTNGVFPLTGLTPGTLCVALEWFTTGFGSTVVLTLTVP